MEPTNAFILSQIERELEQEELASYGTSYVTGIELDEVYTEDLATTEEETNLPWDNDGGN